MGAQLTAINATLGRMIASVPESTTMGVYDAVGKLMDPNVPAFLMSSVKESDARAAYNALVDFTQVVKANPISPSTPASSVSGSAASSISAAADKLSAAAYPFIKDIDWTSDLYSKPIPGADPQKVTTDSSGELLQQGRGGKAMHVVHVSLPLGVELQINRWNEPGEGDYLNTKITMSAQPNQDGHCGNFNGNPADDTRPMIRSRIGTTGVPPGELLFPEPKTPVAPANRPDLNNCPPDQTEHAKTVCERKSHNGIASKECMIDVCFGGDTFADEDANNY